jgi:hypothetical protein
MPAISHVGLGGVPADVLLAFRGNAMSTSMSLIPRKSVLWLKGLRHSRQSTEASGECEQIKTYRRKPTRQTPG